MAATDTIAAFLAAMEAAGMTPVEPIASKLANGGLIRFQCEGDRKGRKNGWAVLHFDGVPAGAFGHHALGISQSWRANAARMLSHGERVDRVREWEAARRKRDLEVLARQEAVARHCQHVWSNSRPANPSHPYLMRKRILGEGLRQQGRMLLVPMYAGSGHLWNIQQIGPDGQKRFAKGGRQKDLHLVLGKPESTILIAEGFSTTASLRRAMGYASVVAFSKDNLTATALSIRARWSDAEIIICADDDAHLVSNPRVLKNLGVEAAQHAARAVGGRVALPPRSDPNE
ncbi:hypothetical protein B2G71_10295 [Novosphingobium sp. PC22D]|uniref:toprim domain-containing protein n=1 Tax=Novosphingobium sp. PC22D TaxID=1962403 RepID=UPI000BF1B93E|nr:toprim domain-containing protein [Novosphingobium sp. PC22D]PEQ12687.1 hypothetical protein B2G71_10295 [Novosphingobium sp. PC22D]